MDIIEETVEEFSDKKEFSITLEEARDDIEDMVTGWKDIYREAEADLEFYDSKNQWDPKDYNVRLQAGRHALTVNRLPQFVHQTANTVRQNTPTIKVLPADSGADIETAEVQQDLIRNIECVSQADIAYDTGVEYAIKCSIGFIRIDHNYTAPDTFEQHILIHDCPNPLSSYIDENSIRPDGSDAKKGVTFDTLPESEFKEKWPDAIPESFDTAYMNKNAPSFTCKDKQVVVAEFFKLKQIEREILLLAGGEIVFTDEYEKLPVKAEIKGRRTITKNQCMRYKMTGAEILEEGEFPSSYIPIIPVFGETHWIKNKRHIYSLIRNAKDTQRMYNYAKSLETELIMKAPKAPYMASEGQLSGYEELWRNPDASNVLIYKSENVNGTPVPPPQRVDPIMVSPGVLAYSQGAVEDMKATMGIYDPSLGQREGGKSGRAIIAEQQQGDVATYHFKDNLSRSVTHVGRILLDMIPRIYDTPRILRVLGEDNEPRNVAIGANGQAPDMNPQLMETIDRVYDISVGKYDVIVTTGPSYANKRMEFAEILSNLMQSSPAIAAAAPDLLVESMDFPNAQVLAKRLKKTVPPQFLEEDEDEQPDLRPQLAQAEQVMEGAAQKIEELQAQLAQMEQEKLNDTQKNMIDAAKLQLDQEKLQLERYKLAIEEQKVAVDAQKNEADVTKHKADKDAEVKINEMATGSYVPENVLMSQGNTDMALGAMAEAISSLSESVALIGQGQAMIAGEMAKPKKIVANRINGQLVAEVIQ